MGVGDCIRWNVTALSASDKNLGILRKWAATVGSTVLELHMYSDQTQYFVVHNGRVRYGVRSTVTEAQIAAASLLRHC